MFVFLLWWGWMTAVSAQSECQVTAIVSYDHCTLICKSKYGNPNTPQQRAYFNYTNKQCQPLVRCPPQSYLRASQNKCYDQFDRFTIQGVIVSDLHNFRILRYVIYNGRKKDGKVQCHPGWRSSKRKVKLKQYVYNQYFCDVRLRDGEIFPKTHGEYFFDQMDPELKVKVLEQQYGTDNVWDVYIIVYGSIVAGVGLATVVELIRRTRRRKRRNGKGEEDQHQENQGNQGNQEEEQ